MPTQVEHVESGIFYARWSDPLTWDDIGVQSDYVLGFADQNGIEQVVVIIDLSQCSRFPMEVQNMRRRATMDQRVIGYVVVNMNLLAQMMVRMLDRLTAQEYCAAETPEEAIALARDMLHKHEQAKP
ncbi:MAG: hypothetical protein KJ065_12930 [Anaerolineae bacterium]|nr:hypothetical protein [Anaerolineae bacterium]